MTVYNYNHLYYFYITAKSGGVTNAAKHLHISQPSLSSQLKILEHTLNVKLFEKIGRKNQLSKSGDIIYKYSRQMFELSDKMGKSICKGIPSNTQRIDIGISEEIDRSFVSEVVSFFLTKLNSSQRPKIAISMGTNEKLTERLRFKELDAIITDLDPKNDEFQTVENYDLPIVLTCSTKQMPKMSSTRGTQINDVIKETIGDEIIHWAMPSSRLKLRSKTDHFLEINQVKGHVVFESDEVSTLMPTVEAQIGLAFLPKLYIHKAVNEQKLKIIGDQKGYWNDQIYFISHQQNKNDALIKLLASSFKKRCNLAEITKGEMQMALPI